MGERAQQRGLAAAGDAIDPDRRRSVRREQRLERLELTIAAFELGRASMPLRLYGWRCAVSVGLPACVRACNPPRHAA